MPCPRAGKLKGSVRAKLTFDQHSFSPAWSPDGKKLAFDRVDADGDTIIAKDVSGSGAEEVLFTLPFRRGNARGENVPQRLYTIGWTPDGKCLLYRGPDEVSALALEGGRKSSPLFPANLGTFGVAMSPDGRELFFTNTSSNTLMSASLNITADHFQSYNPQPLFDLDAHPVGNYVVVTRDGQKIYMTNYGPGSRAPFTVTTNWSGLVKK